MGPSYSFINVKNSKGSKPIMTQDDLDHETSYADYHARN